MPSYLKTIYNGISLYYAGKNKNTIKLEPQKQNAVPFTSYTVAQHAAKKLAYEHLRDDFFIEE
ncbi:hypothetical protein [Bartonella sp. B30(2025)]